MHSGENTIEARGRPNRISMINDAFRVARQMDDNRNAALRMLNLNLGYLEEERDLEQNGALSE